MAPGGGRMAHQPWLQGEAGWPTNPGSRGRGAARVARLSGARCEGPRSGVGTARVFLQTNGCGTPTFEPNTNRNVNGEDARAHSWPWQISMQIKHGSRWHHTCGGTVIGSYWILTAGHCIWPGDVYHVVMGEHDQSVQEGTEQVRDVLHILVHADWDIHMVAAGF
ncbi:chymotrypsin-like elastase family member 3B [Oncorhynchus tshawytscha]|uniref:chymotrypsin-like elastase family member 3B n=1 Tax=Oncorhynchus tshawytscha TaxID=74940 RepID=UPI001C3C5D98|nr:chymotrypsin-like elastase family member 3B [Oncorhynchus tshawytscha]